MRLGPSEVQITDDLFTGLCALNEREGGMMHLSPSAGIARDLLVAGGIHATHSNDRRHCV